MPGIVKLDIVKDTIIEDDGYLRVYRRKARVESISKLTDALKASGMPQICSTYPGDTSAYLVKRVFSPGGGVGHFSAEVELIYENLYNPVIELGTALVAEQSSYDQSGDLVKLSYKPITSSGTTAKRVAAFTSMRPVSTLKATRFEHEKLNTVKATVVGCYNNAAWAGGDAGTWVVYDVQSVLKAAPVDDSAVIPLYQSSYTFAYKGSGWRSNVFWILPDGSIPQDIDWPATPFGEASRVVGNGWQRVQVFRPIDFTARFGDPLT